MYRCDGDVRDVRWNGGTRCIWQIRFNGGGAGVSGVLAVTGISDVSESRCVSYNSAVRCNRIRDQVYQGLGA